MAYRFHERAISRSRVRTARLGWLTDAVYSHPRRLVCAHGGRSTDTNHFSKAVTRLALLLALLLGWGLDIARPLVMPEAAALHGHAYTPRHRHVRGLGDGDLLGRGEFDRICRSSGNSALPSRATGDVRLDVGPEGGTDAQTCGPSRVTRIFRPARPGRGRPCQVRSAVVIVDVRCPYGAGIWKMSDLDGRRLHLCSCEQLAP